MCSSKPRMLFQFARLCGIPLILCAIAENAAGQCYYTWEQIPTPSGWHSAQAVAMNNLGQVVGSVYGMGDYLRGFLWTPEGGTQLLPLPPGVFDLRANDINDLGQIVGTMYHGNGVRAFIRTGTSYSYILYPAWANNCEPYSINNRGQVVGMVQNNVTDPTHAFFWEHGVFTDLGPLIGDVTSVATDINELGQIIGYYYESGLRRAFIVDQSQFETLAIPRPLEQTYPGGISNSGVVAGFGVEHLAQPFMGQGLLWDDVGVQLISSVDPAYSLEFSAINDALRVVGTVTDPLWFYAAVWQSNNLLDIRTLVQPSLPLTGTISIDINHTGQILLNRFVLTPHWSPSDLSGDCHVSVEDLVLVLGDFGAPAGSYPRGDVDLDGDVDLGDLAVLLAHWGE